MVRFVLPVAAVRRGLDHSWRLLLFLLGQQGRKGRMAPLPT